MDDKRIKKNSQYTKVPRLSPSPSVKNKNNGVFPSTNYYLEEDLNELKFYPAPSSVGLDVIQI